MLTQLIIAQSEPSMAAEIGGLALSGLSLLGSLFLFVVGLLFIAAIVMFFIDVTQTKSQYFFALDREEMPFNRAERQWVDHVCQDGSDVVPFGSTKVLTAGTPIFANGLFPALDDDMPPKPDFIIGPQTRKPYQPGSLFNISAMSYGSLSKPAVQALSHGAALSKCFLNTGEGGVSPYHLEGGCDVVYQLGTAKSNSPKAQNRVKAESCRAIK